MTAQSNQLQIETLHKAIQAQESLRPTIGDEVVDSAVGVLREQLAALEKETSPIDESQREKRRVVTVLFAHISGFTQLSENLDPEDTLQLMNAIWERLDSTILAHGGLIDKHMGDQIIALWGAESAREDDAEQAIRAALDMRARLAEIHPEVQIHSAIHSGLVMLGQVGSKGEYTAMGKTMNLTSRLEQMTPGGCVYISQDTYRLARGLVEVGALPIQTLRGLTTPIQAYQVLRLAPRIFRPHTRGIEGIQTRMVGRDAEISQLRWDWRDTRRSNKLHLINIYGEAGLGKSRLLYEFEQWLIHEPHTGLILRARATERSQTLPHGLVRDLFANLFDIQDNDSLPAARQKLEQGILRVLGSDSREKAQLIGHLLGLDFSESPAVRGILHDPGQIRDRARQAMGQFLRTLTETGPIAILMEDLHWADDDSLDTLGQWIRSNTHWAILFISVSRPVLLERRPEWANTTKAGRTLHLKPLSETASHELLRELLQKMDAIPPALAQLVVEGSDGNPFYCEEIIKMLIDQGAILTGERWQANLEHLQPENIPDTLTGILQARLDGLPEQERLTLQCASVVGKTFWAGALGYLCHESPERVERALRSLQERELIFPRQSSSFINTTEYVFKHAILRDVVYQTVLKRKRREYHALAAEWLIEQGGERAAQSATIIAGHFEAAENIPQAAEWYGRSGKQAFDAYAPQAAIQYYRKAFEYVKQAGLVVSSVMLPWYENLGKSLQSQTLFQDALEVYLQMRQSAENMPDYQGMARAWYHISFVQDHLGDVRTSLESADQAAQLCEKAGNAPGILLKALNAKGWAHYHLGESEQALEMGELSLELSRAMPDSTESLREQAHANQLLGAIYDLLADFQNSARCEAEALQIFRRLGDQRGMAAMLNNQGVGAFLRGAYQEAIERYSEALHLAHEIGSIERESIFLSNLGGAKARLGQSVEAEADLRRSIDMVGGRLMHYTPLTYCFLAEACLGQTKLPEAVEAAQQALALGEQSEQKDVIATTWRVMGNCSAVCKEIIPNCDLTAPETCYENSERICREIGSEAELARTLQAWAKWEQKRGYPGLGQTKKQEADMLFQKLGLAE